MPAADWAHVMSLDLGWLAPGAARQFVERCAEAGLLEEVDGALRPSFDRKTVDIPPRFRPGDNLMPEAGTATAASTATEPLESKDVFPQLLQQLEAEKGLDRSAILAEVDEVQEHFGGRLTADAAMVRVALGHGLDVREAAGQALASVTTTAK